MRRKYHGVNVTPVIYETLHYRPTKPEIAAKYADKFAKLDLVTVDKVFGGWKSVSRKYFGDRGIFDTIYEINQASR